MKRAIPLVSMLLAVILSACGQRQQADIISGHHADIECGQDGQVHARATQYDQGGTYTLNGGADNPFQDGFNLTLDGTKKWTIVVDSFASDGDFSGSAGPCVQSSTTSMVRATSTTMRATTTTCPDCVVNTVVITGPTTTTTVVQPPPPPPGSTTSTSSTTSSTTSTSTTTSTTVKAPAITAINGPAVVVAPAATTPPTTAALIPPASGALPVTG